MGERLAQEPDTRKGAKTKLFGVVLIFLGILDSMLAWRGGFAVNDLYVLLIALGLVLYIVGAIRQRGQTKTPRNVRS